jgi:hypothetical protein
MKPNNFNNKDVEYYLYNIINHFYLKIEELDFFIEKIYNLDLDYRSQRLTKDIKYLHELRYYFSAFLNSLYSLWEITQLSIHLDNYLQGLEIKKIFKNKDLNAFEYFFGAGKVDFDYFTAFENARNSATHDGTITLDSGIGDEFRFSRKKIVRFIPNLRDKNLYPKKTEEIFPVDYSAIRYIFEMAISLVPLFYSKLVRKQFTNDEHKEFFKKSISDNDILPQEIRELSRNFPYDDNFYNALDDIKNKREKSLEILVNKCRGYLNKL